MPRVALFKSGLLLVAMLYTVVFASAATLKTAMRITVLDSVTQAGKVDDNGVPKNCDQATFDAYCRSTSTVPLVSTLLVQEDGKQPFRISCTIESRYSRCTPLPRGASYDARREKRGITVYYVDDKGKARKQLYALADTGGNAAPLGPALAVASHAAVAVPTQPASSPRAATSQPSLSQQGSSQQGYSQQIPSLQSSTPPGPGWVQTANTSVNPERTQCNFSSTPSGAEITVDGKYVGNTPSQVSVSTGTHVVTVTSPGFAEWKRELTVFPGSDLNVSAVLQKM